MKVFYICRTGHHTSLLAAAIHLGMIKDKPRQVADIYNLPGYDDINLSEIGKPYVVGVYGDSQVVYTIGVAKENILLARIADELISLMGVRPGEWQIVDTSDIISRWTLLGQKIKRTHLHTLCKVFFYLGARNEWRYLTKLVQQQGNFNPV